MKKLIALTVIWGSLLAGPAFAQNHGDVVAQVAAEQPPDHTLEGAMGFTLRVLARLNALYPAEGAGLLEKVAGENIVPYSGTLVSASRIAYPNQHIFKVLTDVPTTNGPQWSDDGFVSVGGYMKGYLAVGPSTPVPPSPPPVVVSPPAPIFDVASLQQQIADLIATLHEHVRADGDAHASINQNVTDGRAENRSFFAAVSAHWKSISAIAAPLVTYWTCHATAKC